MGVTYPPNIPPSYSLQHLVAPAGRLNKILIFSSLLIPLAGFSLGCTSDGNCFTRNGDLWGSGARQRRTETVMLDGHLTGTCTETSVCGPCEPICDPCAITCGEIYNTDAVTMPGIGQSGI